MVRALSFAPNETSALVETRGREGERTRLIDLRVGVLAWAFIGLAAVLSTTILTGSTPGSGDWAPVYVGNLIGALGIALMVWLPEWWKQSDGAVGATALSIAAAKTSLPSGGALLVGLVHWFVYLRDRR